MSLSAERLEPGRVGNGATKAEASASGLCSREAKLLAAGFGAAAEPQR